MSLVTVLRSFMDILIDGLNIVLGIDLLGIPLGFMLVGLFLFTTLLSFIVSSLKGGQ